MGVARENLAISCRALPPVGPALRAGRAKGWLVTARPEVGPYRPASPCKTPDTPWRPPFTPVVRLSMTGTIIEDASRWDSLRGGCGGLEEWRFRYFGFHFSHIQKREGSGWDAKARAGRPRGARKRKTREKANVFRNLRCPLGDTVRKSRAWRATRCDWRCSARNGGRRRRAMQAAP